MFNLIVYEQNNKNSWTVDQKGKVRKGTEMKGECKGKMMKKIKEEQTGQKAEWERKFQK